MQNGKKEKLRDGQKRRPAVHWQNSINLLRRIWIYRNTTASKNFWPLAEIV
jgi:hypothetical protein